MKIRMLLLTAVISAALVGCGAERKSAKPEKLSGDMDKTAEITLFGREYKAELRRGGEGVWECGFTEPESLAGLKMTYDTENCRIELDGLQYQCDGAALPEYGLMPLLATALETLIDGKDISCTVRGDYTEETGETSGQRFVAKVKGGELTELEVDKALTVRFR
ncbi:MAG: hypothetical protein K6F71_16580 [Ruminococcus sp.]|uniref:hypothetical protein n=1 Tax=Ruminococcus sp. TaxID=41978 RepID=UPI0025DF0E8B|nr:hypothetical protein [Ruminococcus sp.]MCR5542423.1 hypothetical protein [Ruminococcus sp.]